MKIWYRLSLICGIAPLSIGTLILVFWLITDAEWLQVAGILTIIVGLFLFTFGIIFLGVYFYQAKNQNIENYFKKTLISLGVLVVNFPAAAFALLLANYIISTSTVLVVNNSKYDITDLVLSERNKVYEFPIIGSQQRKENKFHFIYEGEIKYHFKLNDIIKEGILFGYVTSGRGEEAVIYINNDGVVNIEH